MKSVIVIGGSNLDLIAQPVEQLVLYDSNPGSIKVSHGGVARNIAENLALLDVDVTLITPLAKDFAGNEIYNFAIKTGIKVLPIEVEETSKYIAIMDKNNDLYIGISGMSIFEMLTYKDLEQYKNHILKSDIIVLDTNLSDSILNYIFSTFKQPIYVDAISTKKAEKLRPYFDRIKGLKMNIYEACYLSNASYNSREDINEIAKYFDSKGVKDTIITLGEAGSVLYKDNILIYEESIKTNVINATGAGDAFFAGIIYALIHNLEPLKVGTGMAHLNLIDQNTVSKHISSKALARILKEIN
ncbi:MAG: carbohydrate kinase family protein [Candidatus Izemoplasmataceae bacterium]